MHINRQSPSSRRAWIEIISISVTTSCKLVALLAEGVDRNVCSMADLFGDWVALLAEGVDRNKLTEVEFEDLMGRPPRGGRG